MPKTLESRHDRFKLITAFLTVGIISLIQPGCNSSSSNNGTPQPPPVVTSVSPASDSVSSLVTTNVSVIFNNDMDSDTVITAFTLTLNSSPVAAIVNYDAMTKTALLIPQAELVSDTEYRASIDPSVKDINGDSPLSSDYVWSFKVSSAMQLVSKNSSGVSSNDISRNSDIDATGQFIVFESDATNLTSIATTLNQRHIYRKDTISGAVVLVSSDASGLAEANNLASNPSISSNGRYVAFESAADNLDGISNGINQIYLKDLSNNAVSLISLNTSGNPDAGFGGASNAKISDDGRYILFQSQDRAMSAIDGGGIAHIYRKDMDDDTVTMISRTTADIAGNNASTNPDMSSDGKHIVFESLATNFTASNSFKHIFYVDASATTHNIEQISLDSAGAEATSACNNPSVSNDGLMIVYDTNAILDGADTNGIDDVYLRSRPSTTNLVSVNPDTGDSGNGASRNASISGDASFVAFESLASDLVTEGNLGAKDIFVRDLSALPAIIIDRINNPVAGGEPSSNSDKPAISNDGRYISFHSIVPYTPDDTDTLLDTFRAHNSIVP